MDEERSNNIISAVFLGIVLLLFVFNAIVFFSPFFEEPQEETIDQLKERYYYVCERTTSATLCELHPIGEIRTEQDDRILEYVFHYHGLDHRVTCIENDPNITLRWVYDADESAKECIERISRAKIKTIWD